MPYSAMSTLTNTAYPGEGASPHESQRIRKGEPDGPRSNSYKANYNSPSITGYRGHTTIQSRGERIYPEGPSLPPAYDKDNVKKAAAYRCERARILAI